LRVQFLVQKSHFFFSYCVPCTVCTACQRARNYQKTFSHYVSPGDTHFGVEAVDFERNDKLDEMAKSWESTKKMRSVLHLEILFLSTS